MRSVNTNDLEDSCFQACLEFELLVERVHYALDVQPFNVFSRKLWFSHPRSFECNSGDLNIELFGYSNGPKQLVC